MYTFKPTATDLKHLIGKPVTMVKELCPTKYDFNDVGVMHVVTVEGADYHAFDDELVMTPQEPSKMKRYETPTNEHDITDYNNSELMDLLNGKCEPSTFIVMPLWIAKQVIEMEHVCDGTRDWAWQIIGTHIDAREPEAKELDRTRRKHKLTEVIAKQLSFIELNQFVGNGDVSGLVWEVMKVYGEE